MATDRQTLEAVAKGDPLPHLEDPRPEIRRLAAAACATLGSEAFEPLAALATNDPDDEVRAEAVEVLGGLGPIAYDTVRTRFDDPSMRVVEAATTALGEIGDTAAVPWLVETSSKHESALVREAAIAALGSIGDGRALPVLLEAVKAGKPHASTGTRWYERWLRWFWGERPSIVLVLVPRPWTRPR